MKKTGLFFGTFNPIHIGHLIIAQFFLNETDLEEVWFVISPKSPFKQKEKITDDRQRLYMVQLAIEGVQGLRASDVEFGMPKPNYTVHTLEKLRGLHPDKTFVLLMGADNIKNFRKWYEYEQILAHHTIYIYPRPFVRLDVDEGEFGMYFEKAPSMDISSTYIRDSLKAGKDVRFLLHHKVWNYIDATGLYTH
ncbi:putative nicotinate-nucleotide adenylyltransferase [Thermaurantimonas aggregans]|uniref:Probable nicotinate-nucleotide adenylyltransferase n=1 Tax=Thermaurantimonas aggregans TaxID=2173829 RepID=A0A401XHS0_9FLAO|nr:nicotinate (nicotinamide) nucleotide adenylyltransferase [Thermaurantimonas aggregans]MCX8149846.1 nicotinate (nicotinamide) nucleotide adenylyltransferase [Thermaurantimonas aggregans]GCD76534.1 putative nicotinate-nucleotide adenylyltransferase [Thermaurantimonas aggregans]